MIVLNKDRCRIVIIGTGYVGLSLAMLLAQHNDVIAVDTDVEKVRMLNDLRSPITDADIERFLAEAKNGERELSFRAVTDGYGFCSDADFVIIAVPTDYDTDTNSFDCSAVESSVRKVADAAKDNEKQPTIVIKSTVPVGYTKSIRDRLNLGSIIVCPEFLRETKALYDNLYPSRIVIGCDESSREMAEVYAGLLKQGAVKDPVETVFMNYTEAEAVKLFSNTYLAMRIAFFNELDTYAEVKGLDTASVIRGVCLDPRIGDHYNNPSFGYGGYCLPKDTKQLLANYRDIPEDLIRATVDSNDTRNGYIADRIIEMAGSRACAPDNNGSVDRACAPDNNGSAEKAPVIGVHRLTMKTGSDNFRYSSVQGIIKRLQAAGMQVVIYEPLLPDGSVFWGSTVENDLQKFKSMCSCIITNRYDSELDDASDKVYTRDLFGRD